MNLKTDYPSFKYAQLILQPKKNKNEIIKLHTK